MSIRQSDYLHLLAKEAQATEAYLMSVNASLRPQRITESRGPAVVTLSGLGELVGLSIEGVDEETQDCLIAALRAAQRRAQDGYVAQVGVPHV